MSVSEKHIRRIACQIVIDEKLRSVIRAFSKDEILEALNYVSDIAIKGIRKEEESRTSLNPSPEENAYRVMRQSALRAADRYRLTKIHDYYLSEYDFNTLARAWLWEYSANDDIFSDSTKVVPFLETVDTIKQHLVTYGLSPVITNDNRGIFSHWARDVVYSLDECLEKYPSHIAAGLDKLKPWKWLAGVVICGDEKEPVFARECQPGRLFIECDSDRQVILNHERVLWTKTFWS